MTDPIVERATEVTAALVSAMARLVPQLSSSATLPGEPELRPIVDSSTDTLFVARLEAGGDIVGMLTLVTYRIPTGLHAVIEDVVVDDEARGSGAGAALVQAALDEAARRGARNVDLTSRPSREAANRLYVRMGFELRETNVFRHSGS
jgi:ribosomal protein S18 acetylase RimI-like enzyme